MLEQLVMRVAAAAAAMVGGNGGGTQALHQRHRALTDTRKVLHWIYTLDEYNNFIHLYIKER